MLRTWPWPRAGPAAMCGPRISVGQGGGSTMVRLPEVAAQPIHTPVQVWIDGPVWLAKRWQLRGIPVGAKFVNICGNPKAERSTRREAPQAPWGWIRTKSAGQSSMRGAEATMTAVPSIADEPEAGLRTLAGKSAFDWPEAGDPGSTLDMVSALQRAAGAQAENGFTARLRREKFTAPRSDGRLVYVIKAGPEGGAAMATAVLRAKPHHCSFWPGWLMLQRTSPQVFTPIPSLHREFLLILHSF